MFGFQAWLGLPLDQEEADPGFQSVLADETPIIADHGIELRLLAGTFSGQRSPTKLFSETLYADVVLGAGMRFPIESRHIERAVYVVSGGLEIDGQTGRFEQDELVVFKPDADVVIRAVGPTRLMLLGGEPLEGPRHIFWNFVSSRQDRIDQAAEDWRARRFPGVPGDDVEFIPLPEMPHRKAA